MTTQTNHTRKLCTIFQALDLISLHHEIELTPDQARYITRKIWSDSNQVGKHTGHGLSAWQTYQLIKQIDSAIPRSHYPLLNGKVNPNEGRAHHTYRIGREYSRVLYVRIIHSYLNDHTRRNETLNVIIQKIKALAEHYQADEFDFDEETHATTIRLWWD